MLNSEKLSGNTEKARMMAQQYKKYLFQEASKQSEWIQYLARTMRKVVEGARKVWNRLVPLALRGPMTPLEKLSYNFSDNLPELSLSPDTIEQNLWKNQVVLLLTYTAPNLVETIQILRQSPNIEFLIKNNFPLCPIDLADTAYLELYKSKMDMIRKRKCLTEQNHLLVVLWRGIFHQILLLDLFSVTDMMTYSGVLSVIDEREAYETSIKGMIPSSTQNTFQKLSEQTNLTRSTSHSSL